MKKRSKQLDPRAQLAIAIAGPLLLIVAGWMMLVSPQRSKAADVAAQVASAQTQFDVQQAQVLHAPKPVPIRVADIFGMVKAMPDQQDMPGIILQLNQVATEAGITFDSITPQGAFTPPGAAYEVQKISLGFTGDFYGLSDFLYRLRSLVAVRGGKLDATGRLFSVEELSFSEGQDNFPQINAQLVLDAYVYGAVAPAAPPAPAGTDTGATTTDTTATDTTQTTTTPGSSTAPTAAPASTGVNG